jgi:hypothetical protein
MARDRELLCYSEPQFSAIPVTTTLRMNAGQLAGHADIKGRYDTNARRNLVRGERLLTQGEDFPCEFIGSSRGRFRIAPHRGFSYYFRNDDRSGYWSLTAQLLPLPALTAIKS